MTANISQTPCSVLFSHTPWEEVIAADQEESISYLRIPSSMNAHEIKMSVTGRKLKLCRFISPPFIALLQIFLSVFSKDDTSSSHGPLDEWEIRWVRLANSFHVSSTTSPPFFVVVPFFNGMPIIQWDRESSEWTHWLDKHLTLMTSGKCGLNEEMDQGRRAYVVLTIL